MNVKPGLYRHYKNIIMDVIGVAKHSETLEELVIYRHHDENTLWARPKSMFLEIVELNGKQVPRFEFIEETKQPSTPHLI
jgi:hypothetical protein